MAENLPDIRPAAVTDPQQDSYETEISFSDAAMHFRTYMEDSADAESTSGLSISEKQQLGAVTSSQGDRERFGPFFVAYAASKAREMVADSPGEAQRIMEESEIVTAALDTLLRFRFEDRIAFRDNRPGLLAEAEKVRTESRLVETAIQIAKVLEADGYDAGDVARDVVVASGAAARVNLIPVAPVAEPTPIIPDQAVEHEPADVLPQTALKDIA